MMTDSTIVLGSGPDGRIVAEFLSQKSRLNYLEEGIPDLLLRLAQKHKRPVAEIKALCRRYQEQQNPGGRDHVESDASIHERYNNRVCGCGAVDDETCDSLRWVANPFLSEIYGDRTRRWMCPDCYHNAAMDI